MAAGHVSENGLYTSHTEKADQMVPDVPPNLHNNCLNSA